MIIFMLALQVIFGRQEMLLFNLLVHWSWRDNLSYLLSGNNNNIEQWQLAAVRYCYVILAVNRSVLPFVESLLKLYSCKFPVVGIPLHFDLLTELLTLRVVMYLSSSTDNSSQLLLRIFGAVLVCSTVCNICLVVAYTYFVRR